MFRVLVGAVFFTDKKSGVALHFGSVRRIFFADADEENKVVHLSEEEDLILVENDI